MPQLKDICSALFAQPAGADMAVPAGGRLLVAEPFMEEGVFSHSVVSLLDYEPGGGAMGVVLNRKSHNLLGDVLEDVSVLRDVPVFCGGPLAQDRAFFIHTLGPEIIPGARPYMPGMYVGGDFDANTGDRPTQNDRRRFGASARLRRCRLAQNRTHDGRGLQVVAPRSEARLC